MPITSPQVGALNIIFFPFDNVLYGVVVLLISEDVGILCNVRADHVVTQNPFTADCKDGLGPGTTHLDIVSDHSVVTYLCVTANHGIFAYPAIAIGTQIEVEFNIATGVTSFDIVTRDIDLRSDLTQGSATESDAGHASKLELSIGVVGIDVGEIAFSLDEGGGNDHSVVFGFSILNDSCSTHTDFPFWFG